MGIFVLSSVLVIAGIIFFQLQSSHLLDDKIKYHAYLINAQGISTETLVNVSGIEIGQVQTITITDDNKIHIQFYVFKTFQRLLRSDSQGSLSKLSVIGNTSIIFTAGSPNLPVLKANSTISIEEPVTADELIAKLTPVITSLNDIVEKVADVIAVVDPKLLEKSTQDLSSIMSHLEVISRHIAEGKGAVGKIIYDEQIEQDITSSVKDIASSAKGANKLISKGKDVITDTQATIVHVNSVLQESEVQIKAISKIIEPTTTLLNNSNKLVTTLQPSAELINNEAQSLPDLVNKMNSLLDTTNRTLQNAQTVWPLSSVIPETNQETIIKGQPIDE